MQRERKWRQIVDVSPNEIELEPGSWIRIDHGNHSACVFMRMCVWYETDYDGRTQISTLIKKIRRRRRRRRKKQHKYIEINKTMVIWDKVLLFLLLLFSCSLCCCFFSEGSWWCLVLNLRGRVGIIFFSFVCFLYILCACVVPSSPSPSLAHSLTHSSAQSLNAESKIVAAAQTVEDERESENN